MLNKILGILLASFLSLTIISCSSSKSDSSNQDVAEESEGAVDEEGDSEEGRSILIDRSHSADIGSTSRA